MGHELQITRTEGILHRKGAMGAEEDRPGIIDVTPQGLPWKESFTMDTKKDGFPLARE